MKLIIQTMLFGLLFSMVGCSGGPQLSTSTRFWAALRVRLTSGKKELQRSLEAKKDVKSFRMKIDISLHPGSAMVTEVEVSCPDHERITTHIGSRVFQAIRVGSEGYVQLQDGQWRKQQVAPTAYPCGRTTGAGSPWAMMGEGQDMSVGLGSMAGDSKAPMIVTPAALTEVNGDVCQPWVVSTQHPGAKTPGRDMTYTLCLGTHDRLPRQLLLGSGGMTVTYSDWNKPIQIDVPAEAKMSTEVAKAH